MLYSRGLSIHSANAAGAAPGAGVETCTCNQTTQKGGEPITADMHCGQKQRRNAARAAHGDGAGEK
eukprot:5917593-Prymnesium_polylepis.1